MGRIGRLLNFIGVTRRDAKQRDVTVDIGGGETLTITHFDSPNTDASPLNGDFCAVLSIPQSGRKIAVGYVDPNTEKKAARGEYRTYARDASGNVVAESWLKNDGTATVSNNKATGTLAPSGEISYSNENGYFKLLENGTFEVNGVTIDTDGNISTGGTVEADDVTATNENVTLSSHDHGGPPPTPGS